MGSEVEWATCDDLQEENILGVYVQGTANQRANVWIGTNFNNSLDRAPLDLHIHGVLMTSTSIVSVRNYNQGQPRGDVHLLGGVIQNFYGLFGTFNVRTGARIAGYGRLFTFDQRTRVGGSAPPYFPTAQADTVTSVGVIPLEA